jgi:hypothetical protein
MTQPKEQQMNHKNFKGWSERQLIMPNGDQIICYIRSPQSSEVSLHDLNHNLFRFDAQGQVLWQVRRDEQGKLNWDKMHAEARADGFDGYRQPFLGFALLDSDGRYNINPKTGEPPQITHWESPQNSPKNSPKKIILSTSSRRCYELNPQTGIAKNTTPY